MPRNYTKAEHLTDEIFRRKSAGETNRQTAESHHPTLKQVKNPINRRYRNLRLVEQGHTQ